MSALLRFSWLSLLLLLIISPLALAGPGQEELARLYKDTPLTVLDIGERSYDGGNALAVTLSVPLDPAVDYSAYLNVSLKHQGKVDGGWVLSESGKILYFPFIEPRLIYTVTVYRGLTAVNDSQLMQTQSADIFTRDIAPVLSFDGEGMVLPAGHSKGLPVVTVNVDEADIEFHRVDDDKIASFFKKIRGEHARNSYQLNSLATDCRLVYSGRFQLEPPRNKRRVVNIPVHEIKELREPGVYFAVMKQPGSYKYQQQTMYYMVSDLGLHARAYANELDIYVNSLSSAEPRGQVLVSLLDDKGKILRETSTTPQGLAVFAAPYDQAGRLVVARSGPHISILQLDKPALDLSEFAIDGRIHNKIDPFFYSPRDIYRPGETVDVSMLLRGADGAALTDLPVPCKVKRPDGRAAKEFVWRAGEHPGYYHYSFTVPVSAPTGKWQFLADFGSGKEVWYEFKVEEFLPERLKLELDGGVKKERFAAAGEELVIPVLGAYLYGAPAGGNRLSVSVSYAQKREPLAGLKDFLFGDVNEFAEHKSFDLDDILLDGEGGATVKVASRWGKTGSPLSVRVTGSLYESGGRPVTRSLVYTIWPGQTLIGVRPLFKADELENNDLAGFQVVAATKEGELVGARDLEARLIREDREYYWTFDESRGWRSQYSEKVYTAFTQTLSLEPGERGTLEFPVENGHYRLEVRDPATGALTSYAFHAGYFWWWYADASRSSATRPDVVTLVLDKKKYRPGDTAVLNIVSPHAGKGFVVVESDEPLWFAPIEVGADKTATLEIPVNPAWNRHDIYVSAVVLRPVNAKEKISVNRAMGLTHLKLDRDERLLNATLRVQEKIRPGKTLKVGIQVEPATGSPPAGDTLVTLAAVDVGVLNVTDFQDPDPFAWFFGKQRYGVDSRDMYGKVIEAMEGEMAGIRFGGDEDLSRGGEQPMTEVRIVSMFTGPVALDKEGRGEIDLAIPDFNGRLRLMAVVFNSSMYGNARAETTVAAPVVAEIGLPRFLAPGDQSQAVLDVRNMTGVEQKLAWRLSADGPARVGDGDDEAVLRPGEKVTRIYPLTAKRFAPTAEFSLSLGNSPAPGDEEITMERSWRLGLRPAYPARSEQQSALVNNGEVFRLDSDLLQGLIPETVDISLLVSARPPLDSAEHLKWLLAYPYGCLEQTTSSAFPFLFVDKELLAELELTQWDAEHRAEAVEIGMQRLAGKQRGNGSFGLWESSSPEEHYLTVYAADFMLTAKERGYAVPADLLDKALRRLQYYLSSGAAIGLRYSQDVQHYLLAYRAYAGYVLSRVKKADLAALRILYDHHKVDAKSGLPLVHLGLALNNMGDAKRGRAAISEGLALAREENVYYGDYGSPVRDSGLMIALLAGAGGSLDGDVVKLLFDLADQLKAKPWLSTQERLALLRAGSVLRREKDAPWQGTLEVNGVAAEVNVTGVLRRVMSGEGPGAELVFRSRATQPLYCRLTVSGYPQTRPEPQASGVSIERIFYDLQGRLIDPGKVRGGDLLLAHLVITARQRIADLLVVDLLPAGLELENQNLLNAVKLDEIRIDDTKVSQLMNQGKVVYREYRDDRFIAAVDQSDYQATHLFYLARAVTPGTYQVPPPLAEDMYRPMIRAIGATVEKMVVLPRDAK